MNAEKPDTNKAEIPLADIRSLSPVELLQQHQAKTRVLMGEHRRSSGFLVRLLNPLLMRIADFMARRWLKKTNNPYREEIDKLSRVMGKDKGLVALNLSYEWGCTSCVLSHPQGAKLARVQDWPFSKLGENIVVAHQQGPAGDFYNITWPGLSAVFTAVAKGRFSAAVNIAPMRRHQGGLFGSRLRNIFALRKQSGLPPGHLLRKTFETAADYKAAKKMLLSEPIAAPAIFTLAGTGPNEGCVIERLENKAVVREMQDGRVCATNHFETSLNGEGLGWMPRNNSYPRMEAGKCLSPADVDGSFAWFKAPIANDDSRLALVGDAATGSVLLMGTEGAKPVTKVFKI